LEEKHSGKTNKFSFIINKVVSIRTNNRWRNFIPFFIRRLTARVRRIRDRFAEITSVKFVAALLHKMGNDNISNLAAGISYFAFLSLFPLLLSLLAVFSLFLPEDTIRTRLIEFFGQYLPGSLGILQGSVSDILRFRGIVGLIGIAGLIWSATGVFSAITNAVNKAWEIPYQHPFWIKKPREIAMVAGTGLLFLLSLGTSTLLAHIGDLNLPISGVLVKFSTVVLALVFSLVVFLLVQKLSTAVWIGWRHIWPGALISTFLFEVAKTLFVFYLNTFSRYEVVYGSIASVIVTLVWIYYSAFILLLGAEVSALIFKVKREGLDFDKPHLPGSQL
jgi:membrane protein